jgi:ubiquinone/menaquinone biosynthesis C-methylase UbiE
MTVLEPGPGMGFFTLELARLVGPSGRVVAVDIQPEMLDRLNRQAQKAGVMDGLDVRLARSDSLGLDDLQNKVDFVLAFAMVHEMPSASRFFQEASRAMMAGANLLLAEPAGHVKPELVAAAQAGLIVTDRPAIRRSLSALLTKA